MKRLVAIGSLLLAPSMLGCLDVSEDEEQETVETSAAPLTRSQCKLGGIQVWEHAHRQGRTRIFCLWRYRDGTWRKISDLSRYSVEGSGDTWNDRISSFEIFGHYIAATLYEHAGERGMGLYADTYEPFRDWPLTWQRYWYLTDRISSIQFHPVLGD